MPDIATPLEPTLPFFPFGPSATSTPPQVTVESLLSDAQQSEASFYLVPPQLESTYETHTGLLPMPVAKSGRKYTRPVRAHAEYTLKVVTWTVSRVTEWPVCPHWDTGNENEVLIRRTITPKTPELLRNEKAYRYEVSGEYVYMLMLPLGDDESYPAGTTPIVVTDSRTQVMTPLQFSRDLLVCDPPADFSTEDAPILDEDEEAAQGTGPLAT